ncbi:hypothetical protein [Roseobacter sp. HKCCA0434]|uniref:hypothetical protein n=1 Tax=Roseobacter sp. HKCCA0434 TaxID=3079297 RepID=UPI002905995A|nr:hypothetical protein [Roseobacter sp. HKCCA0434]
MAGSTIVLMTIIGVVIVGAGILWAYSSRDVSQERQAEEDGPHGPDVHLDDEDDR